MPEPLIGRTSRRKRDHSFVHVSPVYPLFFPYWGSHDPSAIKLREFEDDGLATPLPQDDGLATPLQKVCPASDAGDSNDSALELDVDSDNAAGVDDAVLELDVDADDSAHAPAPDAGDSVVADVTVGSVLKLLRRSGIEASQIPCDLMA